MSLTGEPSHGSRPDVKEQAKSIGARWHFDDSGEAKYIDVSPGTHFARMISENWAKTHRPNPGTKRIQLTKELLFTLRMLFGGAPQSLFERDYDRPAAIGKLVLMYEDGSVRD